jgi:hypothetical protein
LRENVRLLVEAHGLARIGFMTLTFARNIRDIREAQRRFNSLASHVLTKRYRDWICVVERHQSQRVHFHLVVAVGHDIRAGIDFAEIERKNYASVNPALYDEWDFWRATAKKYGFGRVQLMPVKTNAEAIANYVAKYIEKHVGCRIRADKGARLVRYSKNANPVTSRYSWNTTNGGLWRRKLKLFAERHGLTAVTYAEGFRRRYGKKWTCRLTPLIQSIELPTGLGHDESAQKSLEAAFQVARTMRVPGT